MTLHVSTVMSCIQKVPKVGYPAKENVTDGPTILVQAQKKQTKLPNTCVNYVQTDSICPILPPLLSHFAPSMGQNKTFRKVFLFNCISYDNKFTSLLLVAVFFNELKVSYTQNLV